MSGWIAATFITLGISMKNILVIRRDNIGDMVCTTPLLEGLKQVFPEAKLTLLVNKVAEDVVRHNPHVDRLFVYKKAKHRSKHENGYRPLLAAIEDYAGTTADSIRCHYSGKPDCL